jgi:hypothetical protein
VARAGGRTPEYNDAEEAAIDAATTLSMAEPTLLSRRLDWLANSRPATPIGRARVGALGIAAAAAVWAANGLDLAPRAAAVEAEQRAARQAADLDSRPADDARESGGGRPLYEVVVEESAEFTAIEPGVDDIIVAGGRRDFHNWHSWTVMIPAGEEATARLLLTDEAAAETVLAEHLLAAGRQHNLQLHVESARAGAASTVSLRVNTGDEGQQEFDIPRMAIDDRPSVAGQPVLVAANIPIRLFDKPLEADGQSLVWRIDQDK